MKKLLVIFILSFLFLTSCTMHHTDKIKDTEKVTFSAVLGGWIYPDTTGIIFVKTTLHNNSADTLIYLRMTCSWADSYTTDNDSFNIIKTPCWQNGPNTIRLLPYKSEDEYVRLTTKANIQHWRYSKFRIGCNFNLFDSTRDLSYNVLKLTDMKNIIWSDTLELHKFWKH